MSEDVLGPGAYRYFSPFDQMNKITIGEKRPSKIQNSPGPADYSPDRAIAITKP